jgi:methionyl aminopeptidase
VREVCEQVEAEIERQGGGVAFPAQSSRNALAAHYCSAPDDETRYAEGDLAKLDIGVHVDGWVVDTATTVNVGDVPGHRLLVEAAEAALSAAIAAAAPGVSVRALSRVLEQEVRRRGLRPMRNLCGHGVGRWTVHCAPAVPNVLAPGDPDHRLAPGAVIAIEPFATDGSGEVGEHGMPEVFRVPPAAPLGELPGVAPALVAAIAAFRGLPFARRQLRAFSPDEVQAALAALRRKGVLQSYAALREAWGRPVAQAEHTLLVKEDGIEVLTA